MAIIIQENGIMQMQVSQGPAKVSESIARWRQVYLILKKLSDIYNLLRTNDNHFEIVLRDKATLTACDEHNKLEHGNILLRVFPINARLLLSCGCVP